MNTAEYHKMHALEQRYWWFQGRRRVVHNMLAEILAGGRSWGCATAPARHPDGRLRLVDIGCGTGYLLEDLEKMGVAVGLDFSPVALTYCRQRNLRNVLRGDAANIPLQSASVDVITALDLVEHIRDDHRLMGEFFRILRPGGMALMSVPAHKSLWSNHDVALHHFRRYEKPEFLSLVTGAGLKPVKYSFSVSSAYLPAAAFRRIKRLVSKPETSTNPKTDEFPLPGFVNASLLATMKVEAWLLKHMNLPFGMSLLCIAQKPLQ
ncbi:MAG: class I SAM-dependent methyltransferase [Candidatus Sumerlaeaceae bacterium]|nr:class I SAM-dependent methyltransferase [Candidatus Sumerlaeaceae bacterium]